MKWTRPKDRSRWTYWAYEFGVKQPIDQTLHALWGGVPWFFVASNGPGIPINWPWLVDYSNWSWLLFWSSFVASLLTTLFVVRAWSQWPSSRWWDPCMDWLFFGVGSGLGIWLGLR